MGKYFGTDGIRGVVNTDLDAILAFRIGQAAALVLAEARERKPLFTIGRDTRISGDMLESAMIAGLCSSGADVLILGVVPTPAVAFITKDSGADAGVVISASHNPFEHNGIKIFSGAGFKLSDELELRIEELLEHPERLVSKRGGELGHVLRRGHEFVDRYIDHIVGVAGHIRRLRVMIDCANGAAARTVNEVFSRFPIDLELIKDHPDGVNINESCGSTHPELLGRMVVAGGFDVGFAFDGDADRCLVVDERGELVDGDKIMAICGEAMLREGKLKGGAIVATVMSNLGFHEYVGSQGMEVHCTDVGDRHVLEKMLECGYNLGGEQSGHIIFLDEATTGDGQLAAVKFLSVLSESGKKVSELVSVIPGYPQLLENVPLAEGGRDKAAIMSDKRLKDAVEAEKRVLANRGRVLIRPSGTEALIRVMVEAVNESLARESCDRLTKLINFLAESAKA